MRKQTKIVAVASAAALLAIGASMTSFAAYGWVEEDGTWYYYDRDENRIEDQWKKSGDNWYWLSSEENGAMAVDTLVEDDDDLYYVDANGVMVRNTWVRVVNEDQDDDDDPAEYNYYYMQSNGKAYKNSGTGNLTKKTIDGKIYAFDDEGKMLYGWVDDAGEMQNGEDDWTNGIYYFGNWDDGAMKTGWQQIYVHDYRKDSEDDYYYWFNFKPNGKKRTMTDPNKSWKYTSNGKYYHFDSDGVMVYQWNPITTNSSATASNNTRKASGWAYYGSPEDGARNIKGWFKVVAPNEDNTYDEQDAPTFAATDATDETERWYYSDGYNEGLVVGEIKKIKGKYYGFRPEGDGKSGAMLTGLCALVMGDGSDATENAGYMIKEVFTLPTTGDEMANMDADKLEDFMDYMDNGGDDEQKDSHLYLYYFGNDEDTDGTLKTGNVTINLDGESYQFQFKKSGSRDTIGRGLSGIEDGKYIYRYGMRVKADSDEKYKLVRVDGDTSLNNGEAVITTYDGSEIAAEADEDKVLHVGSFSADDGDRSIKAYFGFEKNYYLVNTSGRIQTGTKSGTKDGDGCYWYLYKDIIRMYTDDKDLGDSILGSSRWQHIGEGPDNAKSTDEVLKTKNIYKWTRKDLEPAD